MTLPGKAELPDHEARLDQARNRAEWDLGDSTWADEIIAAYCDPKTDDERLRAERRTP